MLLKSLSESIFYILNNKNRDILDENDFDRAASDIDISIAASGRELPVQEKETSKK